MKPLTVAKLGSTVYIKKIDGQAEVRQHLADLGFHPGEMVTVVNEIGGNYIVKIMESRVAVSKEMAESIMI